jgi:hypothetical protein
MPLMAVDIKTTTVIPMNIPSIVSEVRTLFARKARKAISKPSLNSKRMYLIVYLSLMF